MLTASAATGTGKTGVGMGSVVDGTKASGPGMGKGSGTTRATSEGVGEGIGKDVGVGLGVDDRVWVGKGVSVRRGVGLGVVEGIEGAVAVGGEEPRETGAIAAMAGGSASSGGPTIHPTITVSRSNIAAAGSPAIACRIPCRRREGLGKGPVARFAAATPEGEAATRRHAHCRAA
jgi:hypothetical protein